MIPFNLMVFYNNWLQRVGWSQVFEIQCRIFFGFLDNNFNFFAMFGCMSIIIYFVYIHFHFSSWLILSSSFFIFWYWSCNALLYMPLNYLKSYFKSFFIIRKWNAKFGISLLLNISKCDAHFETNNIVYFKQQFL